MHAQNFQVSKQYTTTNNIDYITVCDGQWSNKLFSTDFMSLRTIESLCYIKHHISFTAYTLFLLFVTCYTLCSRKLGQKQKLTNLHSISIGILNIEEFTPNLEGSVFFY